MQQERFSLLRHSSHLVARLCLVHAEVVLSFLCGGLLCLLLHVNDLGVAVGVEGPSVLLRRRGVGCRLLLGPVDGRTDFCQVVLGGKGPQLHVCEVFQDVRVDQKVIAVFALLARFRVLALLTLQHQRELLHVICLSLLHDDEIIIDSLPDDG